ncbi:hypothetical protein KRP22_008178 [Phytophthora ramorum]|uniref:uncharacterized protein n=1 Tax=Phytophthora ramorum TaxID=164328 RepID=UPI0030A406B9|nr:hypothetical protein KRP23_12808 [Phytophthora ramorum]KAH7505841.1 hypothetical protein KRP22_3811 [Phytophthora ramorum]
MESSTRKVTRAHLTLHQKAQLRAFLAANPNLPQFAVADWVREHFHVRLGRTTLYRIQSAPEGAFTTGNLSRKKLRRVKYPDFEQQLLDFYLERRERKEDVSDDLLMRKAAECRAACGISDVELKLSNGWLYRFKIRHQLNNVPPQTQEIQSIIVAVNEEGGLELKEPNVPVARQSQSEESSSVEAVCEAGILSARGLTTVQAPGFLNWEPVGEMHLEEFAVVADGILVHQSGAYELTIRVHHIASLAATPTDCNFRVYCDDRIVGQCGDPARVQNNVASSMWVEISLTCDRQSILKVEVLTPGYALTDSSVVLRRIQ